VQCAVLGYCGIFQEVGVRPNFVEDRFNSYLSAAIRDVPVNDRIILDTGDGAAINFFGDVKTH